MLLRMKNISYVYFFFKIFNSNSSILIMHFYDLKHAVSFKIVFFFIKFKEVQCKKSLLFASKYQKTPNTMTTVFDFLWFNIYNVYFLSEVLFSSLFLLYTIHTKKNRMTKKFRTRKQNHITNPLGRTYSTIFLALWLGIEIAYVSVRELI